jgi:hypothetical protein
MVDFALPLFNLAILGSFVGFAALELGRHRRRPSRA